MRVWGRKYDNEGNYTWQEVATDPTGFNDGVYITAFAQVLQLQTNESPFYADYGIPAQQSVLNQIFPDLNVALMQQRYAPYFAMLRVQKANVVNRYGSPTPVYNVGIMTQAGYTLTINIPT